MQVPALFWHELANVMLVNERRGRITPELSRKAIQLVEKMLPSTDKIIDTGAILALGRQHGLSAYDAAYLELAKRIGAPLATLDRKLAQAAEAEGVPVNPTA
jgi:predicted nucleic acid-binding protein